MQLATDLYLIHWPGTCANLDSSNLSTSKSPK